MLNTTTCAAYPVDERTETHVSLWGAAVDVCHYSQGLANAVAVIRNRLLGEGPRATRGSIEKPETVMACLANSFNDLSEAMALVEEILNALDSVE